MDAIKSHSDPRRTVHPDAEDPERTGHGDGQPQAGVHAEAASPLLDIHEAVGRLNRREQLFEGGRPFGGRGDHRGNGRIFGANPG